MTSETDERGFTVTRQYDRVGRLVSARLADGTVRRIASSQTTGWVDPAGGLGTESHPAPVTRPQNAVNRLTDGRGNTRTIQTSRLGVPTRLSDALNRTLVIEYRDGNDGVLHNATSFGTGQVGQAFDLDGEDDFVEIPHSLSLDNFRQATITAWINMELVGGRQAIVSKVPAGNYYLLVNGDRLSFENNNVGFGAFSGSTSLQPLTWYHVAVTWDGQSTTLYLNGVPEATDPVDWTGAFNQKAVRIGHRRQGPQDTFDDFFDGRIDEVGIYDRALSRLEVAALFSAGSAGNRASPLPGIVSNWLAEGDASDAAGASLQPTRIRRADGTLLSMTYDERGNLLTITDESSGATTVFAYDPNFDLVTKIIDAENNPPTVINYDFDGNLTEIVQASGDVLETRARLAYQDLNCRGQVTTAIGAFGTSIESTTMFEYNSVTCNLEKIVSPLLHETLLDYDEVGNVIRSTDAELRATRFRYDEMNRLTQVIDATNSSPAPSCGTAGVTCYTYDRSGNLVAIQDARNQVTTFEYDSQNRLKERANPRGGKQTFDYDENGNLESTTDPAGRTASFEYDRANRLVGKRLLVGTTQEQPVDFDYDVRDNLISVVDSDSSVAMEYDARGFLRRVSTAGSSTQPEVTVDYTYDKNGNRRTMTDALTGTTSYGPYDVLNRLREFTNTSLQTTRLGYDQLNRRTETRAPNGVASYFTYDADSQLKTLVHELVGGPVFLSFSYNQYDRVGNRRSVIQQRAATPVVAQLDYLYDDLDRLKQSTHPLSSYPTEKFSYDEAGNRLLRDGQSFAAYFDEMNRLLEDADFCYGYDLNGNLTSRESKTGGVCDGSGELTQYGYDPEDQLVEVHVNHGVRARYRYDGLGRRIQKDVGGVITRYVYDNEDILLEFDGENRLVAHYTHGPGVDEPLIMERDLDSDGRLEAHEQFFYHHDGLGSIAELTDSDGNVVQSYVYDAYGQVVRQVGTVANPYAYTGRELDLESGLYYYRARYYSSQIGRFLTEDPIGFGGGANFYRYVFNNPTNLTDPSGKIVPVIVAGALFGGAINTGFTVFGTLARGEEVTLGRVAGAFVSGAVSGAVGSFAGPAAGTIAGRALGGLGSLVGTGAVAGIGGAGGEFLGSATESLLSGCKFDLDKANKKALTGFVAGALGGQLAATMAPVANQSTILQASRAGIRSLGNLGVPLSSLSQNARNALLRGPAVSASVGAAGTFIAH